MYTPCINTSVGRSGSMAGADASFGVEIWTWNSTGSPAVVVTGTCMVGREEGGWEDQVKARGRRQKAKAKTVRIFVT